MLIDSHCHFYNLGLIYHTYGDTKIASDYYSKAIQIGGYKRIYIEALKNINLTIDAEVQKLTNKLLIGKSNLFIKNLPFFPNFKNLFSIIFSDEEKSSNEIQSDIDSRKSELQLLRNEIKDIEERLLRKN